MDVGEHDMSILIKMEMPKNCNDCPLFESIYHYHGCLAKPESINNMDMWDFEVGSRPSWCPLIELPPHGDLIDRDALNIDISQSVRFSIAKNRPSAEMRGAFKVLDRLAIAPTIIEAEGGE